MPQGKGLIALSAHKGLGVTGRERTRERGLKARSRCIPATGATNITQMPRERISARRGILARDVVNVSCTASVNISTLSNCIVLAREGWGEGERMPGAGNRSEAQACYHMS